MKTRHLSFLFTILFSMVATSALAYDLAAQNADGVTIYYNYINDGTELMVTYKNSNYNSYSGSVNIPEEVNSQRVTCIGSQAFYICPSLTSVTIPNSVTKIGSLAFCGCTGLTTISIGDGVTRIGDCAFSDCTNLTSITIPNSVEYTGERVFEGCIGLTQPVFNSTCFVYMPTSFQGNYIIPDGIKRICSSAFWACSGLTSITIPNSVTIVDRFAFWLCTGLTSITIPNSVVEINDCAFYGCESMTTASIGSSVTTMGRQVFDQCSALSSVHITDLAAWCNIPFSGERSNPLYYAHHLYLNGVEIKDLVIPSGVANIYDDAFINCIELTSLNIPESVTSIGNWAFKDCTGLTTITSLNPTPPTCLYNDPFANVDHAIPVYVPQGSVLNYKAADWWRNFVVFREIGGDADGVLLTIKDGGNGKTQLLVDENKPYFTLFFKADSGWKLHSVTLNGDNVTPEVGSDGKYTTPALTSSSTINVVYQQSTQSISAIPNSSVQVKARNGEIVISSDNSYAIPVIIYNIDGKVVGRETIMGGEAHVTLPTENIYVIKVDGQTFKVSL